MRFPIIFIVLRAPAYNTFQKGGFADVQVSSQTDFWVMWTVKFNHQLARLIRRPWPIRKFMTLLVRMIWAIDQRVAPMLDKYWKCEEETAGYFVVAKKA
jgi:hypothetical protein